MPLASVIIGAAALSTSEAVVDRFSTNAICRRRNCVNPVFPGLQDLQSLQESTWMCEWAPIDRPRVEFCYGAIPHKIAISPVGPNLTNQTAAVLKQDSMASTAYFYHLSGMHIDPWDHRDPKLSSNPCVKAVWRMVCSTYFPKAPASCKKGDRVPYVLPCEHQCRSYQDACEVECCDESVQCLPEKGVHFAEPYANFTGYGTPPDCTSGARRGYLSLALLASLAWSSTGGGLPRGRISNYLLIMSLAIVALSLQGCDLIASHSSGNWEQRPSYLMNFAVSGSVLEADTGVAPGAAKVMNSCDIKGLEQSQKCSGNGVCKSFVEGVSFCQCASGWSDPECRTGRKSQRTAYLLALFTGFLGLDRFYMGEVSAGTLKLATAGGVGLWWIWDVVRIGAAPIYTRFHGRLAADLPHHLFVISAVLWAALIGYFIFGVIGAIWHENRILQKALLKVEKIHDHLARRRLVMRGQEPETMPSRMAYRVTAPPPVEGADLYGTMASTPPEVKLAAYKNPLSSFFMYAKASEDPTVKSSGAFARHSGAPFSL
mmetsp:Transcript_30304/g.56792  ORF Transcript_30304/g.56792 Transcript_30304/m.56792 type:complete len:543 (+) Transcript_30304:153-1781(+)